MKKNRRSNFILNAIFLALAIAYIIKFAGPATLRLYIEAGIGNCKNSPLLCLLPAEEVINPGINEDYIAELILYDFRDMRLLLPKGFTVVKETIRKAYYKKHKRLDKGEVIYLLYEKPGFFVDLFPQIKKQGIGNNYKFLEAMMKMRPQDIQNLAGTFFMVMKSIFIPDLGRQDNIRMARFVLSNKKGFISYSIGSKENYFNCDITDDKDNFFKLYIKDKAATLNLDKMLAIISTIK